MAQNPNSLRLTDKRRKTRKMIFRLISVLLLIAVTAVATLYFITKPASQPEQHKPDLKVGIESIMENDPYIAVQYPKTNIENIDATINDYITTKINEFKGEIPNSPYASELYIQFTVRFDNQKLYFDFDFYMNHPNLAHGVSEVKILSFDRTSFANILVSHIDDLPIAPEPEIPAAPDVENLVGKKLVALTFDDGPHQTFTQQLLDILRDNDVQATFFMLGSRVSYYPEIARRAYDEGHSIGNHTTNHKDLTRLSDDQITLEVSGSAETIKYASGVAPFALRPPYGAQNDRVRQIANTPIVMWSVDTEDWKSRNTDIIVQHIKTHVNDGDIVLMHDIYSTTIEAARQIIPWLKENGYTLVTVEQLAAARDTQLESGKVYTSFRP